MSTIDAIIEDATRWQRSVESVHGIFAFHVFALVLSSLVPGGSLIRDNGVTFFSIISLDWTETQGRGQAHRIQGAKEYKPTLQAMLVLD